MSSGSLPARLAAALLIVPAAAAAHAQNGTPAAAAGDAALAATVGERQITLAEVDRLAAARLAKVRADEYDARRTALYQLVDQMLLEEAAAAAQLAPDKWLAAQVEKKLTPPTDAEVESLYNQLKPRLGTQTLEQAKPALIEQLQRQPRERARQDVLGELRTKAAVKIALQPPRVAVGDGANPSRGPKDAPVTIVAFSDYQCPYCSRGETTMNRVREVYGERVRIVFRDYPLAMHPQAQKAAEAAGCANDEGKFWEMHDKLFANQRQLALDDLKRYAGEVGLDAARFGECLDSSRHADEVRRDMADGQALGVTGTPAFFVNGRFMSGARPFDEFARVIDEELGFKGLAAPAASAAAAGAAAASGKK